MFSLWVSSDAASSRRLSPNLSPQWSLLPCSLEHSLQHKTMLDDLVWWVSQCISIFPKLLKGRDGIVFFDYLTTSLQLHPRLGGSNHWILVEGWLPKSWPVRSQSDRVGVERWLQGRWLSLKEGLSFWLFSGTFRTEGCKWAQLGHPV